MGSSPASAQSLTKQWLPIIMKEIVIIVDIPSHLNAIFEKKVKDLLALGYRRYEAEKWAALYIDEYPMQTQQTSEKVIEMFGVNLFHMPSNVHHLVAKLAEGGNEDRLRQAYNVSQSGDMDAPIAYSEEKVEEEPKKMPIYITKHKDLAEGDFGAFSYFHTVKFNTPDAWSYGVRATDEGMGGIINRLQKGGYDVIFNTK